MASLTSKLHESQDKYAALKNKIRQYQVHCKSKELKYTEKISEIEEEYKQKLRTLRDRVEEGYSIKEKQVGNHIICSKYSQNPPSSYSQPSSSFCVKIGFS